MDFIKTLLPILTVIANIIFVVVAVAWLFSFIQKKENKIVLFVKKHALLLSAIVALTATCGSLFYSEIAGYTPCKMCWLQRIFMYPQAIILIMAHVWQDTKIFRYTLPLSAIGFVLAVYHYLLQLGIVETTSCTTVGFSLSCSDTFFMTYGYITIPFMAISSFGLLLLFSKIVLFPVKK